MAKTHGNSSVHGICRKHRDRKDVGYKFELADGKEFEFGHGDRVACQLCA